MARNLKIGADISGAKQSLKELSGILNSKEFQGQGAKIVDTKHIEYVKREGSKAIQSMNKELSKQDSLLLKLANISEDQSKSDKVREAAAVRYNRAMKKRLDLSKDILRTQTAQNKLERQSTKLQKLGSRARGMGGILGRMPGMGRLGGLLGRGGAAAAGGMGLGAMGMMGAGGLALGGLAFGASRAMRGNEVFRQGTNTRQNLRALNVGNVSGRDAGMQQLGFTPQEMREAQEQRARTFGGAAASPEKMRQTATLSRMTGVSMEQFGGAAESLRANLGAEGGQKAFAKLQASLLTAGIEEALGPYLEVSANMLTSMNEDGLSMSDEVLTMFSAMRGDGKGMSAERTARIITGLDAAIKGSTGNAAAQLNMIFSAAGIGTEKGGGSVMDLQLAREGGATGFGSEASLKAGGLTKKDIADLKRKGLIGGSQKRLGAITEEFESRIEKFDGDQFAATESMKGMIGQNTLKGRLQALRKMQDAVKSGNPEKIEKMAKELEEGGLPASEKQLIKLKNIIKSVDGTNLSIKAASLANLDAMGEKIQGPLQMANRFLNSIDTNLSLLAGDITGVSTEEEKRKEKVDSVFSKYIAGEATPAELKSLNLSAAEKGDLRSRAESNLTTQAGRQASLKRSLGNSEGTAIGESMFGNADDLRGKINKSKLSSLNSEDLIKVLTDIKTAVEKTEKKTPKVNSNMGKVTTKKRAN